MPAKAKKGEGMDAAKLSKMLGLLKYQIKDAKPGEKKDDALKDMNVYKSLVDCDDRKKFLDSFEAAGSGKGKDSLKFAMSFKQQITASKDTEISSVEDWLTRLPG